MPTIRLVPSTYYLSSSTYLSVSSAANMYTNTDSDTYATVTNSQSGTTSYYIYIRGFNFSALPENAVVTDWTVKLRARESGVSTSSSYAPKLCNGTSQITSTMSAISTTVTTREFTGVDADWNDIVGYGSDFGIRINCRRASRNTTGYMYIYGAEIEVTYTIPILHTVTIQNSTSAIIEASDTNPNEGDDVIISADTLTGITVKDNGTDVTSQFTQAAGKSMSAVPGEDFTTGFSQSGAAFYQSSSTSSASWLEYAIGHSAESPYSTSNTSNTYVKPEGATGWINYTFDFSDIPTSATITAMSVTVYGARENATVDSSHVARFQCYSGSTAKGTIQNFTSTSNSSVTVTDPGTWTAAELHDAQLRFEIGYYGGRMLGITWSVTYEVDGYIYIITAIAADHTIVVTASGGNPPVITVGTPTVTAISSVSGHDQCICTFRSDLALSQWEARATKAGITPARGVGLLVESGGSLAANTNATIYVENEELTNGDGLYTITVYGQSTAGVWSE